MSGLCWPHFCFPIRSSLKLSQQTMADAGAELVLLLCPRAPPRPSLPHSSVYPLRPRSLLRAPPRLRPPICLRCRALDASRPVAVERERERDEEDGLEDEEESYFSVTSSGLSDVDYLGESTRGDLNVRRERLEALGELWISLILSSCG